jgi:hypothetical protein
MVGKELSGGTASGVFSSLTVQPFLHRALGCGQVFPLHSSSSTNAISCIFRFETDLPMMREYHFRRRVTVAALFNLWLVVVRLATAKRGA